MAAIKNPPSQAARDLVAALRGTWHGYTAMCRCPAHKDSEPSLSIRQGDRGILITCFAGCTRPDVLRSIDRIPLSGSRHAPAITPAQIGTAHVERIWAQGRSVMGTLGERYLERRNMLPIPADIRFHPKCPHGAKPNTTYKPALLVAIRDAGRLVAIQRIFLDPDTGWHTGKAQLGAPGAGAWTGGTVGQTLAIAEGFEKAVAFTRLYGIPCWSSMGARRMDLIDIPASVTKLILAGDPDAEGRRAVTKAIPAYVSNSRIVVPQFPQGFEDWSDQLSAVVER